MNDILGIGQWQAQRINERSEVLNELNKPMFKRVITKEFRGETITDTYEISKLDILFFYVIFLITYGGYKFGPELIAWLKSVLSSANKLADGATVSFGSTLNQTAPYSPGEAAALTAIAEDRGAVSAAKKVLDYFESVRNR